MCGLTGVLLYPAQRSEETWRGIIDITTSNLIYNEERGRKASGIAVVQKDGHHRVFKQPVSASALVKMEGYQRALSRVGGETVAILGHTRMPTKGSRWRNVNNHPVLTDHIIGVHNGMITNDDHIFAHENLPRVGEVDSEVIFQLLEMVDPQRSNGSYFTQLQHNVDLLEGTFAALSVDLRRPNGLVVLKHLRPLCLHYEERWQALFFSSRYIFLRKAFGRSVITEALDSGKGYYFDAARLPQYGNRPIFTFDIAEQRATASS